MRPRLRGKHPKTVILNSNRGCKIQKEGVKFLSIFKVFENHQVIYIKSTALESRLRIYQSKSIQLQILVTRGKKMEILREFRVFSRNVKITPFFRHFQILKWLWGPFKGPKGSSKGPNQCPWVPRGGYIKETL